VNPSEGGDTITDFEVGTDKILIVGAIFPGGLSGGTVSDSAFFLGSSASDANDRFGYDASTGEVLFDADGSGGSGATVLATLSGSPAFSASDITVL
jgi:Ca2+-binding RTX toxin-like protein